VCSIAIDPVELLRVGPSLDLAFALHRGDLGFVFFLIYKLNGAMVGGLGGAAAVVEESDTREVMSTA
jgi:hypothetical protein